jgi:hypothetical protein
LGALDSLVQLPAFFEIGLIVDVGIDLAILGVVAWTYRGADPNEADTRLGVFGARQAR